jgi:hypothetical protein
MTEGAHWGVGGTIQNGSGVNLDVSRLWRVGLMCCLVGHIPGWVWPQERAPDAAVLVDAAGSEGAVAVAEGEPDR